MRIAAVALVLAAFAPSLSAQVLSPQYPGGYQPRFDEQKDRDLEEQEPSLPPYPVEAKLVRIDTGPVSAFDFFVDADSVTVGRDGVTRYTLVARSRSGATNVSYEGIHCGKFERKVYAFGREDHTWGLARRSEWESISRTDGNRQRATLAEDFFCSPSGIARSADDAVLALRRGESRQGSASEFRDRPR